MAQTNLLLQFSSQLSGKWKMDILYLLSQGPARWSQLTRSFPDAAPNVLTRQLRQLEEDGLIGRFVSSPKPPHVVEYRLTDTGAKLVPALRALADWDLKFRREAAI